MLQLLVSARNSDWIALILKCELDGLPLCQPGASYKCVTELIIRETNTI
jgi:hypothetical protein